MNETTFVPIPEDESAKVTGSAESTEPTETIEPTETAESTETTETTESAEPTETAESAETPLPSSSPTEEEPLFMLSGKKRRTVWPFIVIPLACILLIAGIFAFWYTRPETILKQSVGSYVGGWVTDNQLLTAFAAAEEEGVIHMELSNKKLYKDTLTMDYFAPTKKGRVIRVANEESEIYIYAGPTALMFGDANDEDSVYGIKPEGIYQQFQESIFFPTADGKYAIPLYRHQHAEMEEALAQFERVYAAEFSETSIVDHFSEEYTDLFFDCLLKEATVEVTKREQNRVMEISLSPEALENGILTFYTALTSDEELIAYLDTYSPMDPLTSDHDNWTEEFEWMMDEAESVADNCRTLKISLTVQIEYTAFSRQLQSVSIALDSPEEAKLRASLDATQPDFARFTMNVKGLDVLELRLTQTDKEFHLETIARSERGLMQNVFDLHYTEQQDGSYRLLMNQRADNLLYEYTLSGVTTRGEGVLKFTADTLHLKVTAAGQGSAEDTDRIGLTVELREEAKSPKFPKKYRKLLTLTEEKLDALAAKNGIEPDDVNDMLKALCEALLGSDIAE